MSARPLDGLKVLDFTHVLAGPFATRVLGDMGADVVKVNSESRAAGANATDSPYYLMWNRNKRALALDMGNTDARAVCRQLCEQADVVIDNFSVGVLDRWGVGYQEVSAVNPGVIYVQMSGMGDGGPWSKFVTYAPTIHALAGLTHLTGVPGREDIGIGYSYNDHQAGLHGAVAILAALAARRRNGRGQRVDVSQFEVGVNFAGPSLLDFFANGNKARATANKLPYDLAVPHNVYRCAPSGEVPTAEERWIAIACMNDAQWQALVAHTGVPSDCSAEQLATAAGRQQAEASIDAHIAQWCAGQEPYVLMALLQEAGVPAGVVQNGADLMERDLQLQIGPFVEQLAESHPQVGPVWADKLPIHFDAMPCNDYQRVHTLGEDNAAVLADWLDMSPQDAAQLADAGVLK
ncbi:MAG: CoA transferase [Pseudomonadota bacterium]